MSVKTIIAVTLTAALLLAFLLAALLVVIRKANRHADAKVEGLFTDEIIRRSAR